MIPEALSQDPGDSISLQDRFNGCLEREDGIEMSGKENYRSRIVGVGIGLGAGFRDGSEDVADGIDVDVGQTGLFELGGHPQAALLFAEGRGGDGYQFHLPLEHLLPVEMEPAEGLMQSSLLGESDYA